MRQALAVGLLLCLAICTAGAVAGQAAEVTGVAISLDAEAEQVVLNEQSNYTDQLDVDARSNAFVVDSGERTHYVLTDQETTTGAVRVRGPSVPLGFGESLVFATEISTRDVTPESVSLAQLRSGGFDGETVRTSTTVRQAPFALDVSGVSSQTTLGVLGGDRVPVTQPGRTVRQLLFSAENRTLPQPEISQIGDRKVTTQDYGRTRWLSSGSGEVTLVSSDFAGSENYYVADVRYDATRLKSPAAVDQQHVGDVVRVTANATGTAISAQETLTSISPCGKVNSVENPFTGCAPLLTDTALHTGAMWGDVPDERSDVVTYVGVSNTVQQSPATAERGEYEVTGRVVATETIDPRLPEGYGIIIYNRERIGDVSAVGQASAFADDVRDRLRDQLVSNASEWRSTVGVDNLAPIDRTVLRETGQHATATAAPTATATPTQTAMPQTATDAPTTTGGTASGGSAVATDGGSASGQVAVGPTATETPIVPQDSGEEDTGGIVAAIQSGPADSISPVVIAILAVPGIFALSTLILSGWLVLAAATGVSFPVSNRAFYAVVGATIVSAFLAGWLLFPQIGTELAALAFMIGVAYVFVYGAWELAKRAIFG